MEGIKETMYQDWNLPENSKEKDLVWKLLYVCKNCHITLNPGILKGEDKEQDILGEAFGLYIHTKESLLVRKDSKTQTLLC